VNPKRLTRVVAYAKCSTAHQLLERALISAGTQFSLRSSSQLHSRLGAIAQLVERQLCKLRSAVRIPLTLHQVMLISGL